MNNKTLKTPLAALTMLAAAIGFTQTAQAHCDSLDGPVIKAARAALTEKDVNLVLIWVQKDDDEAIKHAFERTLAARTAMEHFPETVAAPAAAHPNRK